MALRMRQQRTVEPLDAASCMAHLREAGTGRAILSVDCLPRAVPGRVLFVGTGVALASPMQALGLAAERHDVLAIEVDGIDAGGWWSVHVTGPATTPSACAALDPDVAEWLARAAGRGESVAIVPLEGAWGEREVRPHRH